jgi:hypothetical protein
VSLLLDSYSGNNLLFQLRREKLGHFCKPWMKPNIEVWNEFNSKVISSVGWWYYSYYVIMCKLWS